MYEYSMKLLTVFLVRPWLWLAPLLALWFSLCLGNRPFATPDEGRYVEIPREMVVSNDYVTPRLNGVKYFEKPPLFYWLQAASIKAFGIHEGAMRLWCVFFGILGCLATWFVGRRFYGPSVGMAACLVLATSPLYYALSRLIILDMAITAFVSLSLFSFLMAVHTPAGFQRRLWAWGFYGCSALGVLTKGLMALAIPGPVILIWVVWGGRWKDLWPAYIPSGAFLFFAIAAPWHILASLKNPEFAYKYFIVEHVLRYTTSLHMRTQPFWFFAPVLLLGLFPWVSLLWGAVREGLQASFSKEQRGVTLFFLIWAGWTVGFFSLSNSKLIPYILPCFPPLALVLATYWVKIRQSGQGAATRQSIRIFVGIASLLSMGGLTALWMVPQLIDHRPYLWADFTVLSGTLLTLGVAAAVLLYCQRWKGALNAIPLAALALVISLIRLMPELQRPSIKPLAQTILAQKKTGDVVGSYKAYYQDLPVYMNQLVTVIDAQGELEFGCIVEDCTQWMWDEKKFLKAWKGEKRFFIIAKQVEIEAIVRRIPDFHYILLDTNQGNILITNR